MAEKMFMRVQEVAEALDVHPDRIKNYVTYSLRRLGVDYIDLYQPARMVVDIPTEEIIGAVAELVQQGYVRHIGLSMVDADTLKRASTVHPIALIETNYSLFDRSIESELIPTARELGTGVVVFGLLAQGLLSGSWTDADATKNNSGRQRPFTGHFAPGAFEQNLAIVDMSKPPKVIPGSKLVKEW